MANKTPRSSLSLKSDKTDEIISARIVDEAKSDETFSSGSEGGVCSKAATGSGTRSSSPSKNHQSRRSSTVTGRSKSRDKSREKIKPGKAMEDPIPSPGSTPRVCANIPAMNIPRFPAMPDRVDIANHIAMISPTDPRRHRKSTPESDSIAMLGQLAAEAVARQQAHDEEKKLKSSDGSNDRSSSPSAPEEQNYQEQDPSTPKGDKNRAQLETTPEKITKDVQNNKSIPEPVVWQQPVTFVDPYKELYDTISEPMTVLSELPLHKAWSFWAVPLIQSRGPTCRDGKRKAIKLADCANVGKFWGILNSIAPPSSLQCLLHGVFKKGNDPTSKNFCNAGGRWVTMLELANTADGQVVDELWLTSMLTLVSEDVHDAGEHLVGVSISLKRGCRARLSVWIDASAHAIVLGRQFHRNLRRVASEHRIALNEWHFEDFGEGNFTYLIKATVPPVPEEADECEDGISPAEPNFMGLGSPLTDVANTLANDNVEFMMRSAKKKLDPRLLTRHSSLFSREWGSRGLDSGVDGGGKAAPTLQGSVLKACLG
eukprot:gene957-64_t